MSECCRMRKRMKVLAFDHAVHYTEKYFRKYLKKYIRKVGKMGKKYGNCEVKEFIDATAEELVDILTESLCCEEVRQQQTYIYATNNADRLKRTSRVMVTETTRLLYTRPSLEGTHLNKKKMVKVVDNVVAYAFGLRKELNIAQSVAKTKLQEYWADRTPPLVCILGMVLAGKLYLDIKKMETEEWEDILGFSLSVTLTVLAFVGAFFMVYLRLPHAVDGATRQKASDFYLMSKDPLGKFLMSFTPGSDHYTRQVDECFNSITKFMTETVKERTPHHIADTVSEGAYTESSSEGSVRDTGELDCNAPYYDDDSLLAELESQQREAEALKEVETKTEPDECPV
eukprot:TRINITY_DN24474_c0_g1_i1.p1 TRINITY_DN24474_c0_g1~~TRINITY_DN24474_c0_g1_i1.p1  ORF type:complete len:342 (+),score=93.43 TRINITY_DN24474_c0_g1_i1:74-1099(+)